MQLYFFETHDQRGQMQAATFHDAMRQLCAMVPYGEAGAWGWVEDLDGNRFSIGIEGP